MLRKRFFLHEKNNISMIFMWVEWKSREYIKQINIFLFKDDINLEAKKIQVAFGKFVKIMVN